MTKMVGFKCRIDLEGRGRSDIEFKMPVTLKLGIQILLSNRHLIGEGNGTPLQYSCLEDPMDGGDWWAAVHGVAEGQS